jgi:hypothetical protein
MSTWETTLGWTPSNDLESTKRKYKDLARRLHPNKNPSPTATADFQALGQAWESAQKHYRGESTNNYQSASTSRGFDGSGFDRHRAEREARKRARPQNTREAVLPKDFIAGNGPPVRFEFRFGVDERGQRAYNGIKRAGDVPASRSGHVLGKDIFRVAARVLARELRAAYLKSGLPKEQWSVTIKGGSTGVGQYVHNRYYRPRTEDQTSVRVFPDRMTENKATRYPEYYGWHKNFNFPSAVETSAASPSPQRSPSPGPRQKKPKWEKPPPTVANGPPIQYSFEFNRRNADNSNWIRVERSAAVPASPAGEVLGKDLFKVAARLFRKELREEFEREGISREHRSIYMQRKTNFSKVLPEKYYKPKYERDKHMTFSAQATTWPAGWPDKKKTWNNAW